MVEVRVLVVSGHELTRTALVAVLQTSVGLHAVGGVDVSDAAAAVGREQPEVTVLDVDATDGADPVTVITDLISACPGTRILVLTSRPDRALSAGAHAAMAKNGDAVRLVAAVRSVAGEPSSG